MNLASKPISITTQEIFAEDLMKREPHVEILAKLVGSLSEGSTITINADWGCGKTTFVNMLDKYLQSLDYNTIYLNAWETELASDPLLALIDSLCAKTKSFSTDSQTYRALSPIVSALINIVKAIPSIAWAGNIAETIKNISDNLQEDKTPLDEYHTYANLFEDFRKTLSEYVKGLKGKKLIIFVDELDRCRPDYALEFLERIKHLFTIENIIFVISIDKSIILDMICGRYNINTTKAEGYLRRFVDFEYYLPQTDISDFTSKQFEKHDLETLLADRYSIKNSAEIKRDLIACVKNRARSLRDIEKFVNRLDITLRTMNPDDNEEVIIALTYLYMFEKPLYDQIRVYDLSCEQLLKQLEGIFFVHQDIPEHYVAQFGLAACVLTTKAYENDIRQAVDNHSRQSYSEEWKNTFEFNKFHLSRSFKETYDSFRSRNSFFGLSNIFDHVEQLNQFS